ncbi:MAG TPA: AroM family protein [Methylomirabilota bacterium]|nr:AroM family protein [Methylomirabilota bacterium]
MKTIGAVTIGQTPRDDIVGEMQQILGADTRVVQAGALDGLARADIDALAPAPGDDDALIARLRDGGEVLLAKRKIVPRLQACLDRLGNDVDAFVVLCAGAFPPLTSARPVLMPDRCLAAVVDAAFDGGRLGVIVPIKEQQASSAARWSRVDPGVVVTVASPYDDPSRLIAAAEELRRAGTSLVVMECQGFTSAMKQVVRDVTGAPALLPASVLARFLAELG